jgi:hypothetical protein
MIKGAISVLNLADHEMHIVLFGAAEEQGRSRSRYWSS